mmetsp:Transcript_22244/g.29775  ORF Transcript_22244/g.29775 Transcript_22244/m.29775 type:complete len:89 (+) Transcript_22244:1638-1904(+)
MKAYRNKMIEAALAHCVRDIWKKYDDGNGTLDKDELKNFVQDTFADFTDGAEFSEQYFNTCFQEIDEDGSGAIDKEEMMIFIKKISGL